MELLSPAGDQQSLIAAIQNGADAVYLGARGFNARRGADNFAGDALKEGVEYCHQRGAKVYVTLNTMVRQDELKALEETIREIVLSGADALIVQDFGVAEAARRIAPFMALHASTQMAVHNAQGVRYLAAHGFSRVVLAREMDLEEIKRCSGLGADLEVFGHGALCVSCSGQCLLSSMIGGRSGNRGMCAQPCRMKYKMGNEEGYLLSPRDLMSADILDAYKAAGVNSLKLEGRLKRPEYVAAVTHVYRKAIDGKIVTEEDLENLKQIFNRGGFTHGYTQGIEESSLMDRTRPNHAGVPVGKAVAQGKIQLFKDTDIQDTLLLRNPQDETPVKLQGQKGAVLFCPKARKNDVLVRLTSEKQMADARRSWDHENRPCPITLNARFKIGQTAQVTVSDGIHTASASGNPVEAAMKAGLDENRVKTQLSKTGGTVYNVSHITLDADENAFAAVSEMNTLRREALEKLTRLRCPETPVPASIGNIFMDPVPARNTLLKVQSGHADLLLKALEKGADSVIFAPEDMRKLNDALRLPRFYLCLPQVMREEELRNIHDWANQHADKISGVYRSNISHFFYDWPGEKLGDYPLNVANNLSVMQLPVDVYTPSIELTARQLQPLGGRKELIVYGRIPLMQLRHCPNRAVKNLKGKHRDCRLCDHPSAPPLPSLEDRTGASFPLRRIAYDSGCVLQLMNSVPMMLLKKADKLPSVQAWRILADEEKDLNVLPLYRAALNHEDFTLLPEWEKIKNSAYTTGHYFRGVE